MQITVNGEPREIASEPDTPLLWVLRDELGLTGTKYGCGIASCGACTVHVDGEAVRSCVLPVERVSGEVTTIEGLSGGTGDDAGDGTGDEASVGRGAGEGPSDADRIDASGADEGDGASDGRTLHVVQRAWIEHQVAQCGYCQPGQVMTAAALLAADARPTDETIDRAFAGNLCRCGTYPRIRAAVHAAAEALAPATSGPAPSESSSSGPIPAPALEPTGRAAPDAVPSGTREG